jgi:hypothetical protein
MEHPDSNYHHCGCRGAADYQSLRDADDSLLLARNRVQQEQYNLISAILDLERELNVPFGIIKICKIEVFHF